MAPLAEEVTTSVRTEFHQYSGVLKPSEVSGLNSADLQIALALQVADILAAILEKEPDWTVRPVDAILRIAENTRVKLLREFVAADREKIARLEREARLLIS